MRTKILTFFSENPKRTSKENIYVVILERYPNTKITTFIKELYNLMREGVITRDDNGLYGLGVVRNKSLDDWLPDTQANNKENVKGEMYG